MSAPAAETRARALALAAVAVAGVALLVHSHFYDKFFIDDAFLSLRYAKRLATGHGLTWVDGERVEGYSNLLLILACAALARLGMDLVLAARLLGHLSALAAIGALGFAWRTRRLRDAAPLAYGTLSLALSLAIAAWAMGGLEAPMVGALLAWGLALLLGKLDDREASLRAALAPGSVFALLCLARPDGALLAFASLAGFVLARRFDRASLALALRVGALAALAIAGQLAFRLLYYGEWVPNTALIKLVLSRARLRQGELYLYWGTLGHPAPLLGALGALVAAAIDRARRPRVALLFTVLVAWTLYVWIVGGDWMPAHRFLVPDVIVLAFLGAEALRALADRGGDFTIRAWLACALLLVVAGLTAANDTETPGHKHRWVWNGKALGTLLGQAFHDQQPLLGIEPAGAIGFYSDLPVLDLMGLCDRHIARVRPPDFGRGIAGHEHGDGKYALDRHPDILIFCGPEGGHACYRSGEQMEADPRFARDYVLVDVESPGPPLTRSKLWFRREGKVGIVREGDRVVIPAYLFTGEANGLAHFYDPPGSLFLDSAPAPAPPRRSCIVFFKNHFELTDVPLSAGEWEVTDDDDDVYVGVKTDSGDWLPSRSRLRFSLPRDTNIAIALDAQLAPAHVRQVILRRMK